MSNQGSWAPHMAEAYTLGLEDGKAAARVNHYDQDGAATRRQAEGHTALKWLGCYVQGYRHGWARRGYASRGLTPS